MKALGQVLSEISVVIVYTYTAKILWKYINLGLRELLHFERISLVGVFGTKDLVPERTTRENSSW